MTDNKKLKVMMGIDCYFPNVDGVVQCMHNYLLEINKQNEGYAIAPILKKKFEGELPYKTFWCKSIYIPIYGERYPTPKSDKKMNKEIDDINLDIIHMHSPFAICNYGVKLARKKGIPIVATFHTKFRQAIYDKTKNKALTESLCKKIGKNLNKVDEVFIANESMLEELRSYGYTGNVSYMPLGTEWEKCGKSQDLINLANQTFNLSPDELVFTHVGRLEKVKNIDLSLKALDKLKQADYKFKFIIVGRGPEFDSLKEKIDELNLNDNVIMAGFVERQTLKSIYARTDVLLFPSDFDTFGLVKVEASAFDTPTLTLENSCAGFGIVDNENGYLIKNNLIDYVNKLKFIIANKDNINSIGKKAGDTLYLNWQEATNVLIEKYKDIIANYKPKSTK